MCGPIVAAAALFLTASITWHSSMQRPGPALHRAPPVPAPRSGLLVPINHPEVGRTIAAAVPIAKGELVISERPLVVVPSLRALPRELRRLLRGGARELQAPIANFLNLYVYTNANADVRRKVLTFCSYDVHIPALPADPPLDNDTPPLPRIVNVAMRVSTWWNAQSELARLPRQATDAALENVAAALILPPGVDDGPLFSVEELTRAQCCFALNAHEILEDDSGAGDGGSAGAESVVPSSGSSGGLDPEPEPALDAGSDTVKPEGTGARAAGGTHALFLMGSRLTHVCGRPSTAYHYQNGYGCHRAVR